MNRFPACLVALAALLAAAQGLAQRSYELLPPPSPPADAEILPPPQEPWREPAERRPLPLIEDQPLLLPLDQELWLHGGSYLYAPEGDRLGPGAELPHHAHLLRVPEFTPRARPLATGRTDFLGSGPIADSPWHWPGSGGYAWEPRLVIYGDYELFALAFQRDDRRRDAIGHQLVLDGDLRLTGTERFHVQFRPLGERNTGGSYYQFDPAGYVDNSTLTPQRYWFEGELHSLLGSVVDPFAVWDSNVAVGRIPYLLHNSLLMNDEVLAVAISKNTLLPGRLSNLTLQLLYAFQDVDTYPDVDSQALILTANADRRGAFYEATYAYVSPDRRASQVTHYAALSRTQFYGPLTIALRAMFKWGDQGGRGAGELFVLEMCHTRLFERRPLGIESGVFYCNGFASTEGWNTIGGGNLNRLRAAFEVDPLTRIAAGLSVQKTAGLACGVQLFRLHEDESWIPEVAVESPGGEPVWGLGLRYLRKTGKRTYVEVLGVANFSDDRVYRRRGVYAGYNVTF